jgi:branched-chain amino acid transport system ATP-binding protein
MTAALVVEDLHVAYGRVEAVRGVSLTVEPGEIATVIGPNGAGKTTLLAAIMGLLPARGRVSWEGEDLAGVEVEARVERGIALVPESRALFAEMSVRDNLLLGGFARRREHAANRRSLEQVLARFPRLQERMGQLAGTLSGGERQMLALGRALMARPRLLLLDEPSLGLAPLIVREIFRIIATLREDGVAVLLVEQNARAALQSASTATVLERGEVAMAGKASELLANPRLAATYLGGGV